MDKLDNLKNAARRWMRAIRSGDAEARARMTQAYPGAPEDPSLRDVQHALAREQGHVSWVALREALRAGSAAPDLDKLERLTSDLLAAFHGDAAALDRFNRVTERSVTAEHLRNDVRWGLNQARVDEGEPVTLDHVRLLVARHAWFDSWNEMAEALRVEERGTAVERVGVPDTGDPMQPVELRSTFPMELQDGLYSTTTEVWRMLAATRAGDLAAVKAIVEENPAMVRCEHNYMPPLQLAVREGHTEIAAVLLERGAYDPRFVTYPYKETIHQMAEDRGFGEIGGLLEKHRVADRPRGKSVHEAGHIEWSGDPAHADRQKLEKLINADALHAVEAMAKARPGLIEDPLLYWAEGALSAPSNSRQHKMIDLLLRLGARVPDVAKWAPYYYFKHQAVAERLMEAGMSARHMNWHRTTLLHHVAWEGNAGKVKLLLDHGAEVNAIDDEFRSTPLGLAAKAGREETVKLLLDRGADPEGAGADWARPVEWARKRGHGKIVESLRAAGASSTG